MLPWQLSGIVPHFGVNKPRTLDQIKQRQPKPRCSVPPLSKIKLEANGAARLLIYGRLPVATCRYRSQRLPWDYPVASSFPFALREISLWRHHPPCGLLISMAFFLRFIALTCPPWLLYNLLFNVCDGCKPDCAWTGGSPTLLLSQRECIFVIKAKFCVLKSLKWLDTAVGYSFAGIIFFY